MDKIVPILRVTSVEVSTAWYGSLGYEPQWVFRPDDSGPAFASIQRRTGARLFLSEHEDDGTLGAGLVYLMTTEVDTVHAFAEILAAPVVEQVWATEVRGIDPDGNRIRIGAERRA